MWLNYAKSHMLPKTLQTLADYVRDSAPLCTTITTTDVNRGT